MSAGPISSGEDGEDREAARQAASLEDQLSKDVASWSRTRSKSPPQHAREPSRPETSLPSHRPSATVKTPSVSPPAAKPAAVLAKPFRMSYNGVTTEEYIDYLFDRGLR
jgi:hypothetical protein